MWGVSGRGGRDLWVTMSHLAAVPGSAFRGTRSLVETGFLSRPKELTGLRKLGL